MDKFYKGAKTMKYKRLTERVGKSICVKETSTNDNKSIWNAIERLAELEDKIENGTLIELPCKVGDTVYEANYKNSKVYCHTVYKIELRECLIVYWIDGKGSKDYGYFGKDTFLTKAEAEAKLKELKG